MVAPLVRLCNSRIEIVESMPLGMYLTPTLENYGLIIAPNYTSKSTIPL